MKRRSKAGGKASKAQAREALKTKRRDAPKTASSSAPIKDAQVARLTRELNEAREQQTATSEVLTVISSFSGEPDPVFQAILTNATRICEAKYGDLDLFANGAFQLVASHGASAPLASERLRGPPVQPAPGTGLGRMLRNKAAVQIADALTDQAYPRDHALRSVVEREDVRTLLCVPMIKEGDLIGAISIFRQEVRAFTDKQVELVKNFAAQAVIAIENARLLKELRQRTTDLTESLEQQTATADVLQVISSSPGDLRPVFRAILANATRICGAGFGNLLLYEGETFRVAVVYGARPEWVELRRREPVFPVPGSNDPLGRVVATKRLQHIADVRTEQAYVEQHGPLVALADVAGARTLLLVPMLKEGQLIGVIGIYRQEVCPFTDKQIALVTNFAAQAVIAIENARLLNELRQRTSDLTERTADLSEALEQQTATSRVLQVISSFPGELEPVFATMLENAVRICDATFGDIFRQEGDIWRLIATHNTPPAFVEVLRHSPVIRPSKAVGRRRFPGKSAVHIADLAADPTYVEQRIPHIVAAVELGGVRTVLTVPLLREDEVIGRFILCRQEVRPFTDKQIELVQNFAAQAVIAIENARLLNELRQRTTDLTERTADLTEALEQQTATSEVLRVISSSPGDLQPVFDALLANATRLCEASYGAMWLREGDRLRIVASHGTLPEAFLARWRTGTVSLHDPDLYMARAVRSGRPVQVDDLRKVPAYLAGHPVQVSAADIAGIRTFVVVPMFKDKEAVGNIVIYRKEVRPFTDKQIALVTNFAAQAVIAIENARLLKELRARTDEVEARVKLNQQLEQRVADQVGEIERMSRLRRFLPPQVADLIVASGSEKQLESHRREITALFCDLRGFTGSPQ